mmetsp:Transcript_10206/g.16158  ORF Transcript_10206/g.16158 Transcript_10206/m.16158 type:complete len:210 (-) Transcript_10206:195-824(-)
MCVCVCVCVEWTCTSPPKKGVSRLWAQPAGTSPWSFLSSSSFSCTPQIERKYTSSSSTTRLSPVVFMHVLIACFFCSCSSSRIVLSVSPPPFFSREDILFTEGGGEGLCGCSPLCTICTWAPLGMVCTTHQTFDPSSNAKHILMSCISASNASLSSTFSSSLSPSSLVPSFLSDPSCPLCSFSLSLLPCTCCPLSSPLPPHPQDSIPEI